MTDSPVLVACMGVSGCGKSTIAQALADRFGMVMIEADDLHGDENIARMARGEPLTDEHRRPWMNRVCAALSTELQPGRDCALAFSGLRRIHRDQVRALGYPVLYLHLEGDQAVIAARMAERSGHFMPPELLASQYRDLEPTDEEGDVVSVNINAPVEQVTRIAIDATQRFLRASGTRSE